MTALELAEKLRKRDVSSVELVRQCIDDIRARDGELGAFVEIAGRRALLQARRADALRARGVKAPFLGVPTAIKDHEPVRGLGTRIGSRAFRWLVSPIDGYVARAQQLFHFSLRLLGGALAFSILLGTTAAVYATARVVSVSPAEAIRFQADVA